MANFSLQNSPPPEIFPTPEHCDHDDSVLQKSVHQMTPLVLVYGNLPPSCFYVCGSVRVCVRLHFAVLITCVHVPIRP